MTSGRVGRVVVLATSPRLPVGLLTAAAWDVLRSSEVLVSTADHRQLPALLAAGVRPDVVADDSVGSVAALLHARALRGDVVVWLATPGADEELVRSVGRRCMLPPVVTLEVLHGSYDPPGARLLDVVSVMDRLRSPGGCPWDAQQTHDSLKPYLIEETYEAYDALETGDLAALREELGDVLLQVAFHARLAQEAAQPEERWSIDEVAIDLVDKLVRRHPHVFAGAPAGDLGASWDAIKANEKGRTSVTDGVPLSQPALALAAKLQKRAGRLGAPVTAYDGLGGQLWELVGRCREAGLDPEVELRSVARRYRDRLAQVERDVRADGGDPAALSQQQWEQRWS